MRIVSSFGVAASSSSPSLPIGGGNSGGAAASSSTSGSSSEQVLEEGTVEHVQNDSLLRTEGLVTNKTTTTASASSSVSTHDDHGCGGNNTSSNEKQNNEKKEKRKRSAPSSSSKSKKKKLTIQQTNYCEEVKLNNTTTDININSLDYTQDKPPLNENFDYTNYLGKTIMALDIGSSFVKGSRFKILNSKPKPSISGSHMKFDTHQFYPSRIFYKSNEFVVSMKPPTPSGGGEDWKELENIKKIFLVQEALTMKIKNETFAVSTIIYHFIKGLLSKSITKKSQINGKIVSELSNISAVILTCPTGTTENIKKVYRNCLQKALESLGAELAFEHLFVIEEFVLLKYYCDSQIDSPPQPTLYVDIGHLTLDISIVEYSNDDGSKPEVTFKNGEVGGMSIIHKVIRNKYGGGGGDETLDILSRQFESESDLVIEELESIEDEIEDALYQMMVPLCLIIVQKNIRCVHFAGAVTKCKYFERKFRNILKRENIQKMLDERRCFFKEQFMEIEAFDFDLNWTVDGLSALIGGAEQLIKSSIDSKYNCSTITTATSNSTPTAPAVTGAIAPLTIGTNITSSFDYHVGILDEWENEYSINLDFASYDMYAIQDFELFILKFNTLFDLKKCSRINQHNYRLMGISEFERFTTVQLYIDGDSICTTNPTFIVTSSVNADSVHVNIFFKKRASYAKSILKILREGRLERIPINDAVKTIFQTKETDELTWYGTKYISKFYLTGPKSNKIDETSVLSQLDNNTNLLDALYSNKKSPTIEILDELTPGDNARVRKEMGRSCVACKMDIHKRATRYEITPLLFDEYSFYLEEIAKCGNICEECHKLYKEKKKLLRRERRKPKKKSKKRK